MKFRESGAVPCRGYGVPVSKMWESIEAPIQTSLKTAQDPVGGPFPSGKSRDEPPGKMGSGQKFHHNVILGADFTAHGQRLRFRETCARRPVTATPQQRGLARLRTATSNSLREVSRIQGRVYRKQANFNVDSGTTNRAPSALREISPRFNQTYLVS